MSFEKLFDVESEKEIDELYLYQSDIYRLERIDEDLINIFTNDGRLIEIIGDFRMVEVKLK